MRQRTRLILNSTLNTSSQIVVVATRFVIVPFSIGVLGRGGYGLWVVVGQLFVFTRFLDLGLRSAVAREVAVGLAGNDSDQVSRRVNAAAAYYGLVGILVAIIAILVALWFPVWFDVADEHRWAARAMVIVAGVTLAASLPQNAYAAVVAGVQRYDVIAGSNMLADLLRLAVILAFLKAFGVGGGLVLLAVASGGTQFVAAVLKSVAALRLCPFIRFQPWRFDRTLLRGLVGVGLSSVVYIMSLQVVLQLAQILVGAMTSGSAAADLNVGASFVTAAHAFVIVFGVGTRVVAGRYYAEGNQVLLRHLLLRSTRYCGFFTLGGVIAMWLYSDVLFQLWIGKQYAGVDGMAALTSIARTSRILLPAFGLSWLFMPAFNVLNGMNRHHVPAKWAAGAAFVSMSLIVAMAAMGAGSIENIGWGLMLPVLPVWGVILPIYCCRQTRQPIFAYIRATLALPLLGCLPAAILGSVWVHYRPPTGWWALAVQLTACSAVGLLMGWFAVLLRDDRNGIIESVRFGFSQIRGRAK